jgi:hypothetical protein
MNDTSMTKRRYVDAKGVTWLSPDAIGLLDSLSYRHGVTAFDLSGMFSIPRDIAATLAGLARAKPPLVRGDKGRCSCGGWRVEWSITDDGREALRQLKAAGWEVDPDGN